MRIGFEGPRAIARTLLKEGDLRYRRPVLERARASLDLRRGVRPPGVDGAPLAALAGPGNLPGPRLAPSPRTQCPHPEGPHVRPHRGARRSSHDVAPRDARGERNWDYRYTWIRDTTFALWALYTLGFDWEANDFFWFVADVVEADEDLQIMYGIGGERELEERTLDHLSGYGGARPVRVGNGAAQQHQHDVWGAVLDSVLIHTKTRDHLDDRIWPLLCRQVQAALDSWREPDRGMWEVRGEPKHFTSSKVMCWVAADRGARLAHIRDELDLADRLAGGGRRDQSRRPRARCRRARRVHPALRHERARRLSAPRPARRLPPARRPTGEGDGPRHRRRAHRGRPRRCDTG